MSPHPPPMLRRLLTWALPPGPVRDGLLGDLDELYAERVREGRAAATLWYARQLLSAAIHYPPRRLWARRIHGERATMIGRLARDFRQDLRYAARGLRRSPGFTITVVLTLGLGIGANAAMFGIIDRLMFRPFPYLHDPGSVNRVYLQSYDRGTLRTGGVSIYTRFLDLERFGTSFARAAGFANFRLAVGTGDAARERLVGLVSASFFDFFDAEPALGRWFDASEDRTMFAAFGGLALVVAAIGLYGSIGYGVAQRMHELGVRAALGARRRHLIRLVLAQALRVTAAGLVFGTVVAWALGAQIQPLLFQQQARDPIIFGTVGLVLALVATVAGVGPARRAAQADPNTALRAE